MPLTPSSRLGPYEVVSLLGAGGMGEVYRARDTRLDRTVAIKVLPADKAADPDRRQRLEREARAISRLNHPHICTLHDVGHQDGTDYLVMEYLEGESLAARLERGPLPLPDVLRYGSEIADALDKAHRNGIVHRDLKPANVMLTKAGVKLLDFGLAKPTAPAAEPPSVLSEQETRHRPLTGEGMLVGTVPYMAPEQLEGQEADARSDIWALGTVLYEMATGRRAFSGATQASLIAAILQTQPAPIAETQPLAPAELERVVRACLAKDPDQRWQSAHDVATGLGWVAEGRQAASTTAPRSRLRERLWMAVALLAVLAAAAVAWMARPAGRSAPLRLSLVRPPNAPYAYFDAAALAPDGRSVAFTAWAEDGPARIWVRPLDGSAGRPLEGTEGGRYHFWSADGRSIGFFAEGKLKRVDASGGPARVICDAPDPQGGAWNEDDVIVFGPSLVSGLYRVPASGGTPVPVTQLRQGEEGHRWPSFLPDGRHFVFLGDAPKTEDHWLRLGSLDGSGTHDLVSAISNGVATSSGHLLYAKGGHLLAQRIDVRGGRLLGEPVSLAEQLTTSADNHRYEIAVSATGLLAYRSASPMSQLEWYDRAGQRLGAAGEPGIIEDFAISPDGQRVAFSRLNADRRREDLWLLDLARGLTTRLTTDRVGNAGACWSPDGTRIAYTSFRSGLGDLYQTSVDDPGPPRLLLHLADTTFPSAWTPDGGTLIFTRYTNAEKGDLWTLPAQGEPRVFLQTAFDERDGRLSPDGRWIAYTSDESGQDEIYVQAFPGGAHKRRVSLSGGWRPRWRRDGRELFFSAPGERVMAVAIAPDAQLQASTPRELFRVHAAGAFDASADGQRFLVNVATEDFINVPLTVVVDWTALLQPAR